MYDIYQYWEGPKPDHIKYCMQSVRYHHPSQVIELNRTHYEQAIKALGLPATMDLIPQKQADIVRAFFCGTKTGIWIDADYLCFKNINGLLDKKQLDGKYPNSNQIFDFVGYEVPFREPKLVDNDFFWLRGDSNFSKEYIKEVCRVLAEDYNYDCKKWAVLGADILTKLTKIYHDKVLLLNGDFITPLRKMVLQWDSYFENEFLQIPGAYGTMLVNSESGIYLNGKSIEEWRKTKTVFGALIRECDRIMKLNPMLRRGHV